MSTSSPWTYLGSQLITEMAKSSGYEINIYPVNFGQIFPVSGGLPLPKRAPQRQAYRLIGGRQFKSVDFEIAGDELIKLAHNSIGRT